MERQVCLLSPQQVAERVGLSVSTLAKLRLTNSGPRFRKLGVAVRYDADEVERWIEQHPQRRSTTDVQRSGNG